jgi:CRISPR-associated protein Csx10
LSSQQYIAVTPKSPIRVGEAKPGFSFLSTSNVIPGSVIRGTLAEYLIKLGKESEIKNFVKDLRFGFLFPSKSRIFPLPLPETSLTCKRKGGFKGEKGAHGIFDSLLATIAYVELRNLGARFPVPLTFTCNECGEEGRLDRVTGIRYYIKERTFEQVRIERFPHTKVAINRYRKTSKKGMLYTITAIRPKNIFIGKFLGDSKKLETIINALEEIGLGAHTSKGYGKVKAEKVDLKGVENLKDRIATFNDKLSTVWSHIHAIALNKENLPKAPKNKYLSVDLLSPAILKDGGSPTLKFKMSLNGSEMEPILFASSPIFIGGWSTAWGLPKETNYGADIGSTYVFKVNELKEKDYDALERMEREGIGKRVEEGYGDVLICHPFHKEVMPV